MTKFQIDPGWVDEIRSSPGVEALVVARGEALLAAAQSNAHAADHSGAFADSIEGALRHSRKGVPDFRVTADDPAALSIEFGTAHQRGHRALGRAVDEI